ncbi:NAD-dependent epimerase/dehydratase family protein [Spirosoma montaniterrae]|uniref:NAD-dependent epimerase/dehydratase domain-containing protein n=1 Tax=Spirosoma montaniterrae TaxID=1178516 RepID=A0A1P9WWB1_9BACT|nr:NAD-dependent epimerase/dehydratase family protein [Spirosoma montaniterrae]AQG79661.1 hypothetical protein AWR27_10170 [Spirosoma montaniterrae]
MVIGSGMIAQRFSDYHANDNVVIFASGVSNSKETRSEPYARERQLVETTLAQAGERLFVYFSTGSINDPTEQGSAYVAHKLAMEELISSRAIHYLIVRASNVVGGPGNPHTILNYFWERIQQDEPFTIWQYATRNLIDLDDLYEAVTHCITNPARWNQLVVIANPYSVSPLQIVEAIEMHTNRKARYELIAKGLPFSFDTYIHDLIPINDADWQPHPYLLRLLRKYYL